MTGRFGAPRGSIPRIVAEAADIAEQRLKLTSKLVDSFTEAGKVGTLGGGSRLAYDAFRALLQSDQGFQQQIANRWLFSTPQEKKRLLEEIRRVFPAGKATGTQEGMGSEGLPPEVIQPPGGLPPPGQMPPGAEMGMGLGGPAPGAAPPPGAPPPAGVGSGAPPALPMPPPPQMPLQGAPPGSPPPVLGLMGPLPMPAPAPLPPQMTPGGPPPVPALPIPPEGPMPLPPPPGV